ncbi:MAG: hypothetical protein RR202_04975 [Bacteroidales bacterium]
MRERLFNSFVIALIVSICIGCERQYDAQNVDVEDKIEIILYKGHLLHIIGEERRSFCNDLSLIFDKGSSRIVHFTFLLHQTVPYVYQATPAYDEGTGMCRTLVDLPPGNHLLETLVVCDEEGDTLFSAVPAHMGGAVANQNKLPLLVEVSGPQSGIIPSYTLPLLCVEELHALKFAFERTLVEFIAPYGILFQICENRDSPIIGEFTWTLSTLLRTDLAESWFLVRENAASYVHFPQQMGIPYFHYADRTGLDDRFEGYLFELEMPGVGSYEAVFSVQELHEQFMRLKGESQPIWRIFLSEDTHFHKARIYPELPTEPFF